MHYPERWNGRIKVSNHDEYGRVTLDGKRIGTVKSKPSPGTKTSKGLQTNVVWTPVTANGLTLPDFLTQTEGVDALIEADQKKVLTQHLVIGFQIVNTGTDDPPEGMKTFEVYDLEFCLTWLARTNSVLWRLLPVFEDDVEEPTFPNGKPQPISILVT